MGAFTKFLEIVFPAPSAALKLREQQPDKVMAAAAVQRKADKHLLQRFRNLLVEVNIANTNLRGERPTPASKTREAEIMMASIKLINKAATTSQCPYPCQHCLEEHIRHPQPKWKKGGFCAGCKDTIKRTAHMVSSQTPGSLTRIRPWKAARTRYSKLCADLVEIPDVESELGCCRRCSTRQIEKTGPKTARKIPYFRMTVTDMDSGRTEKVFA